MKSDAIITLASDRKSGRWAAQITLKGSKTYRTGDRLNSAATSHTLLSVALTFALRTITKKQAERLIAGSDRSRPQVLVITDDAEFGAALNDLQQQPTTVRQLRAGRNFADVLLAQLRRFDLSFAEPDAYALLNLTRWMKLAVMDPKTVPSLPPVFVPTAISV